MKFATTSDINNRATHYLREVSDEKEEILITRNGKPIALILPMDEDDFADYMLVKKYGIDKQKIDLKKCKTLDQLKESLLNKDASIRSKSRKRP